MNKNKFVFCMGMALTSVFSTYSFAAYTGNGSGTVHFTGVIQDATCKIKSGDEDQTVNLGTVSKSEFKSVGDATAGKKFSVHLIDCPTSVAQNGKVALRFDGTQDKINSDLLEVSKIKNTGATAATGVAIGIYSYKNHALLPLFTDSEKETINYPTGNPASLGEATFDFIAKYVSTAAVTAGPADADAYFTIAYD